jgi:hypothetical protein
MNFEKYILVYKKIYFYKYLPSTYVKCLIVFLGKVNPTGKTEEEDAGSPGQMHIQASRLRDLEDF